MRDPEGESMAARTLVCLGMGFVAGALARRLQGWRIIGTHRSAEPERGSSGADELIVFDIAPSERLSFALAHADAVLVSVPPDEAGCPAFRLLAADLARPIAWVGYLSTTGVYGDLNGGWAFEDAAPAPTSEAGRRRALAETQWRSLPSPAAIFRLPGIYGPGRSVLDRVRAGDAKRIVKPGQIFSRAHVDDIASALALSLAQPNPGRIYNVCDDMPAPAEQVTLHAAELLGMAPPPTTPYSTEALTPAALRFWSENKRVSNARIKAELDWRPIYPSYREGLAAILASEKLSPPVSPR
jgi:nucleoside-diphosphate-sugar epimerase